MKIIFHNYNRINIIIDFKNIFATDYTTNIFVARSLSKILNGTYRNQI